MWSQLILAICVEIIKIIPEVLVAVKTKTKRIRSKLT